MCNYLIDIEDSIKNINIDIDEMEKNNTAQIILNYFCGAENEREFILEARRAAKARGYECVHEYEDDELLIIVRKVA